MYRRAEESTSRTARAARILLIDDEQRVLRRIVRKLPSQQVIIVSCLTETATKVSCLEAGAGDYLAKPFSLDELLARVQAHLRVLARSRSVTTLEVGRLKLDMVRREADSGSGPVPLAEREFLLLCELMRHAGQTVSKERLLSSVWQYDFDSGSNVVDVYVGRLRAKLGAQAIRTVRGKGYQVDGG